MALVSLQNVSLSFGGTVILENLNLQIEKNQRICLLGRNGAGKTTLMRTLAGEVKPDSGIVQTGT
ncbi:MAG TPA: ATP-binding cassette domain-containing protein, partial [Candidatus Rifleibacterium sp.]|nr:ATP-binding cassette domain-containing protein [Candidatus Rifleibacterium sp.]